MQSLKEGTTSRSHCERCSRQLLNLMPANLCIECKRVIWHEQHPRTSS
jgi:hypothetical protein